MKGLKTPLKPYVKCSVSLTSKISQLWKPQFKFTFEKWNEVSILTVLNKYARIFEIKISIIMWFSIKNLNYKRYS